jgi:hypothetical protein
VASERFSVYDTVYRLCCEFKLEWWISSVGEANNDVNRYKSLSHDDAEGGRDCGPCQAARSANGNAKAHASFCAASQAYRTFNSYQHADYVFYVRSESQYFGGRSSCPDLDKSGARQ